MIRSNYKSIQIVETAQSYYLSGRLTESTFRLKRIDLQGKSTVEEIAVIRKDMPNFFVEAVTVADGRIFQSTKEIVVPPEKRVLNVAVEPSGTTFKPGEKRDG